MTGEAHWIEPLLMILGGLGVVLMIRMASRGTLLRRRRQHGICPYLRTPVDRTVLQDALTHEWVDVERCSASIPEDQVSCNKGCLLPLKRLRA